MIESCGDDTAYLMVESCGNATGYLMMLAAIT